MSDWDEDAVNKPHNYVVYDDKFSCPSDTLTERAWRNQNKFVLPKNVAKPLQEERWNLLEMRHNRKVASDFLKTVNNFRTGKFNEKMQKNFHLEPMTLSDELTEVAKSVWMERTSVPDGFILLPEYRITRNGNTYGCMVFCTPKTDHVSNFWLGRHAANYWILDAKPVENLLYGYRLMTKDDVDKSQLVPDFYYPVGVWPHKDVVPDKYPYDESRGQGLFADQLVVANCRRVGIYFDMVQMANCFAWKEVHMIKNITCLVAVFEQPVPRK